MFPRPVLTSCQGSSVLSCHPSVLPTSLSRFFQITHGEALPPRIHRPSHLFVGSRFLKQAPVSDPGSLPLITRCTGPGYIKNHSVPVSWALKFISLCNPPTWAKRVIVWLGKVGLKGHSPSRGQHTKCRLTPPHPLCLGQRWCGSPSACTQLLNVALVLGGCGILPAPGFWAWPHHLF